MTDNKVIDIPTTLETEINNDILIPAYRQDIIDFTHQRKIFREMVYTFEYLQLFFIALSAVAAFLAPNVSEMLWMSYISGVLNIIGLSMGSLTKLSINRSNEATKQINKIMSDIKDGKIDEFLTVEPQSLNRVEKRVG